MKKQSIDTMFPGQQTKTVTVYIKRNEQDQFIQLYLPLFEEDDKPGLNSN